MSPAIETALETFKDTQTVYYISPCIKVWYIRIVEAFCSWKMLLKWHSRTQEVSMINYLDK